MFSNAVSQLPLTDTFVDELFINIQADSFEGDVSFCATLRSLLYDRLQPDESIQVKLDISDKKERNSNVQHIVGVTNGLLSFNLPLPKDYLYVRVLKGLTEAEFEAALNNIKNILSPFTFLADVSLYISQTGCKSYVYINEDKKQTLVFMLSLTQKAWHKMQSAMPKLIPWYFIAPVSALESQLLHSLTERNSNNYINIIQTFVNQCNFRDERLRKLLKGFGLNFEKQRHKSLLDERIRNDEQFNRLQNEVSKCITRERELLSEISGIEALILRGDGTGLADYFICNKTLNLVEVTKDSLSYVVTTYLEYFDQSVFEKCFDNPRSYFYNRESGPAQDKQGFKRLLSAIYGDNICIRVRTCAAFTMMQNGTMMPIKHSAHLHKFAEWIAQPHIDGAACMGSNVTHINQLMREKKYIEAIEQTIASTKNINFTDTYISSNFIRALQTSSQKFLELPSGDIVSPKEAVNWLCGKECN